MRLPSSNEVGLYVSITLTGITAGIATNTLTEFFLNHISFLNKSSQLNRISAMCLGITGGITTSTLIAHKVASLKYNSLLFQFVFVSTISALSSPILSMLEEAYAAKK
jgi:hypothetical protein